MSMIPAEHVGEPASEWERSMEDIKAGRTVPVEQFVDELKAPASPPYPASEGRAAMDAMCPPETPKPPERFPETRRFNGWELAVGPLWYARVVENVDQSKTVVMMVDAAGNATLECVKGMPGELAVVRRDSIHVGMVPVSRDDLRMLFQGLCDAATMSGHLDEPDFDALSRAAAALGDVELPEWMETHAAKEGWT